SSSTLVGRPIVRSQRLVRTFDDTSAPVSTVNPGTRRSRWGMEATSGDGLSWNGHRIDVDTIAVGAPARRPIAHHDPHRFDDMPAAPRQFHLAGHEELFVAVVMQHRAGALPIRLREGPAKPPPEWRHTWNRDGRRPFRSAISTSRSAVLGPLAC